MTGPRSPLTPLAAALALAAAAHAGEIEDAGRLFESRCASCHTLPDRDLEGDRAWLGQVPSTAWTSTPAGARAALVKWLERQTPAPRAPRTMEGCGRVTASFATGSAVLKGRDGEVTLAFDAETSECALEPGKYRVRTVRIVRDGWIISMAGPDGPALTLKDIRKGGARTLDVAETARLEVPETVHFKCHAKRKGGKLQLGFGIAGADRRGLTVYKDGKRVPVTYKVLGKDGEVLAEGTMTYGWGGGGWASVEPGGDAAKVEYAVETGPFKLVGETSAEVG